MNKTAIKSFAMWARDELMACMTECAAAYGITKDGVLDASLSRIDGRMLTGDERRLRTDLIHRIEQYGYDAVIEETAYCWFKRFITLRYMEANDFLPDSPYVFTDDSGVFCGDAVRDRLSSVLNRLSGCLPALFNCVNSHVDLLFSDDFLNENGVISRLVRDIPRDDWRGQIQMIGWLYQFYNTAHKDAIFAKNEKITKDELPTVTQFFTPDWIVRYMVENSLGRLYAQHYPNEQALVSELGWRYYVPEINTDNRPLTTNLLPLPLIKLIDPCMGSGHILVYAFDVLMAMYEREGYSQQDAVTCILQDNLFGLDIDDRASQLAYFAVMMKARQYDPLFFTRGIQPHITAIAQSNDIDDGMIDYFASGDALLKADLDILIRDLYDAKEYGSMLSVTPVDFEALSARIEEIKQESHLYRPIVMNTIVPLIRTAEIMARQYDVTVTNPPYMAVSSGSQKLIDHVKTHYPDSKSDLFAVFTERCGQMLKDNGYQAMITMHSWMFLTSYEKLRTKLLERDMLSMLHLGTRAFDEIGGEIVQTTAFVMRASKTNGHKGVYCRLTDAADKEHVFLSGQHRYISDRSHFAKIPGAPIAYWLSDRFFEAFENGQPLGALAHSKQGIATADNDTYVRAWFECGYRDIVFDCGSHTASANDERMWYPYNKGGEFRKWYGNDTYVVNWQHDGEALKKNKRAVLRNPDFYFKPCFSWSLISSALPAFRFKPQGQLFDVAGMSCFADNDFYYLLALCNSKVSAEMLKVIAPTLNYQCGDIAALPVINDESRKAKITQLVKDNIALSQEDWDAFETSWNFKKHPLV